MPKKTFIPALFLFFVGLLIPQGALAYDGPTLGYSGVVPQLAPLKKVIHTVQKDESLWQIAKFFSVNFPDIAQLNQLENPDLIFPGDQLVIEIREDFSIRVTETGPHAASTINVVVAHVIYPDKNDILSPENPLVVYKEKQVLSQEHRAGASHSKVFRGFLEFVQWLMGETSETRQTQATGTPQPSPSPSSPFFLPQVPIFTGPLGVGIGVQIAENAPPYYQPDTASPPPKS